MLMLAACKQLPPAGRCRSGWDLYLACAARSAGYLASRGISVPFCVQLDPRSAFDAPAMLRQAAEVRERIPAATIKVPLTRAGLEAIQLLTATGVTVNATWGFSVAQLVTGAQAIAGAPGGAASVRPWPRHVLTLMEGRVGDLGLCAHVGRDPRRVRAAECVVFEAAYDALQSCRAAATLLASSLRAGPGSDCWHYRTKMGRDVIVTLPPSFLRRQGLPRPDADYGHVDDGSRKAVMHNYVVGRYAAGDGFKPSEFDRLPPLLKTHQEAVSAMSDFDNLAGNE